MVLSRRSLENAWDVFILIITGINLLLILFDFTYLTFRPQYVRYALHIVQWYDPIKGIEPHRITESYRLVADSLYNELKKPDSQLSAPVLKTAGDSLTRLSLIILAQRPYERFGLMAYQERLKADVVSYVERTTGRKVRSEEAFRIYWSLTSENAVERLEYYHKQLRYYLMVNYYRHYSLSGSYVDNFWKLDLPFLLFFWAEFWAGWFISVRFRRYRAWWLYPLTHWYDVLALTPFSALRVFRLLRFWNLYVRLRRINVFNLSDTLLTRFLSAQSQLIAKSISDAVAYQALEQLKRRVQKGEEIVLLKSVIKELKPVAGDIVEVSVAPLVASLRRQPALYTLLEDSLSQALRREFRGLAGFAAAPLEKIVRRAAGRSVENILSGLEEYYAGEKGRTELRAMAEGFMEALLERLEDPTLQERLQQGLLISLTTMQENFRQDSLNRKALTTAVALST